MVIKWSVSIYGMAGDCDLVWGEQFICNWQNYNCFSQCATQPINIRLHTGDMTQVQQLSCLQEVIRQTVYLCLKNMLLSNTLIDLDVGAHLRSHTLCSSSNPSAICQQKYGLPTASEDRHEYLCFLKADRQAQLPTWWLDFPFILHQSGNTS